MSHLSYPSLGSSKITILLHRPMMETELTVIDGIRNHTFITVLTSPTRILYPEDLNPFCLLAYIGSLIDVLLDLSIR